MVANYDLYKLVYVCVIVISHLVLILALTHASHVNRVTRLPKLCVSGKVLIHSTIGVLLFQNIKSSCRLSVSDVLVVALRLVVRVAEHSLAILNDLGTLGLSKSHVEHVLVGLDQAGIAAELIVHLVLRVAENITLVGSCSSVRLSSVGLRPLIVLT